MSLTKKAGHADQSVRLHLKLAEFTQLARKLIHRHMALTLYLRSQCEIRPCGELQANADELYIWVNVRSFNAHDKASCILIQDHRQHSIIWRKRQRGEIFGVQPYHEIRMSQGVGM